MSSQFNKVAVVTGASRGIGSAIATALAAAGARVDDFLVNHAGVSYFGTRGLVPRTRAAHGTHAAGGPVVAT